MRSTRLLHRIAAGNHANVRFADLQRLVEACGFELARVSGSHHIFAHPHAPSLNLQEVAGTAKPYQVRQAIRVIKCYGLHPEGDA